MREQRINHPPYHRRTKRSKASQLTLANRLESDLLNIFNKSEAKDENNAEAGEEDSENLVNPFVEPEPDPRANNLDD